MSLDILKPKLLPVTASLTGVEYNVIYNPTTEKLERHIVSSGGNFININGDVFRIIKGYTGSVKNTGVSLVANDFICDGIIRNNGVNLDIIRAKYLGGDITNFGTYNPTTGQFTGGNYNIIDLREI